jgi:adenylate cyclase
VTWTTRRDEGWSDAHLDALQSVGPPLARIAEIYALRRTAGNLLDAYIGRHAGDRILAGQIRLGDTEAIEAAIWLSDMRGFTVLADSLPPRNLIALLNRYFGCQVPAILAHGGEVLKFMGDGLLAIFPLVGGEADKRRICEEALAAAGEARAQIAALADFATDDAHSAPRFGLALHRGEVLYGNIGGGNRLDFTCIGPAVNLTARLETLAGRLGRSVVASRDFAASCGAGLVSIGEFELPGFANPENVFGLAEEGAKKA